MPFTKESASKHGSKGGQGRAKGKSKGKSKGKVTKESASKEEVEAADEAMEKFVAAGLRARQDPGHVKVHRVGLADMAARADAVCDREAWENAMEIMRERKSGWVHARVVSGGD